ncbi:MAG: response regulator [Bacteroidota bacterium]
MLILEDSHEDAFLLQRKLTQMPQAFLCHIASSEKTFHEKLIEAKPGLVLADYEVPGFSGLFALEMTKSIYPDVPFVFVTGKIGEELAAETVLNGASAFLLKDNLNRLETVLAPILGPKESPVNPSNSTSGFPLRIQNQIQRNTELLNKVRNFLAESSINDLLKEEVDQHLADQSDSQNL